ncbi:MAG: S1 RNA-binding domain-containing protein [Ruminococcaceae bacterium]|nr:S1 RNA-binding domain-containing protein [Oscillospiraceae bacterium]
MELSVGSVLEGKVTGITKFGAFITLPEGRSGLVHISEIANAYVNDVHDFLTMGQMVNVKVLSITPDGKINLSIKQTLPVQPAPRRPAPRPQTAAPAPRPAPAQWTPAEPGVVRGPSNDASFEDKLKQFMQESDSRMSGNKLYADRKGGSRRRK